MLKRVILSPISAGSKRLGLVVGVDDFFVVAFVALAEVALEVVVSVEVDVGRFSVPVVVLTIVDAVVEEEVVDTFDSFSGFVEGTDPKPNITIKTTTVTTVISVAKVITAAFFIRFPPVLPFVIEGKPVCTLLSMHKGKFRAAQQSFFWFTETQVPPPEHY